MAGVAGGALLRADGLGFTLLAMFAVVSLVTAAESLCFHTVLDADGGIVVASDGYWLRELWRARASPGAAT
jgi:hypothetical protein